MTIISPLWIYFMEIIGQVHKIYEDIHVSKVIL